LTAWYTGSAFLLVLLATGFLYWVLVSNLDREDDQYLADKVRILSGLLREKTNDIAALKQEVEWEWAASQHPQFSMRVLDDQGQTILESAHMHHDLPVDLFPTAGAADAPPAPGLEIDTPEGRSYRLLAARTSLAPGGATRVLQIALDRSFEEELLRRYRTQLWLVLCLSLLVCAAIGYQIARRGLRPIAEITATARRIRSTTLHERIVAANLPAELSVMAATFNEMLDRLEESFGRLERFSADIAHELRTPVNNLRGEVEVALGKPRTVTEYREVLGSCLEEGLRLSRIIDSLLFLARSESAADPLVRERVDLGRELTAVCEFYEAAAAEAGVALRVRVPETLVAGLDRLLFQRAVGNLIANALAHTPRGGSVTVAAMREGNAVAIDVVDTGHGITPEHLPHVFDRFYRADNARSTASGRVGLGLAIVKSIATLHHGTVTLTSERGQGTQVRLLFPSST
jgi:two-component system heavy metal sensor histidine kinase CusS